MMNSGNSESNILFRYLSYMSGPWIISGKRLEEKRRERNLSALRKFLCNRKVTVFL